MTYIIAECGVNHGGSPECAHAYIDAAKEVGADAIKFQTWCQGEITGKYTSKAKYMEQGLGLSLSRYEMSERLRLPLPVFKSLKSHADSVGIDFLTTPDGPHSLKFLLDEQLLTIIKVGSTEITNIPFLRQISSSGLPVFLSTGTANFSEVAAAVDVFLERLDTLTLMQCTSAYPCPDGELNLRVISQYINSFPCKIGFSDHSTGTTAAVAAVALGAVVVEKHIYIDSDYWTPDIGASLPKSEFSSMVNELRRLPNLLGSDFKHRTISESLNLNSIRRKVVAAADLQPGTILSSDNLALKRADGGLEDSFHTYFLDRVLKKRKFADQPISFDDVQ